jgi:hypothetical protein
MRDPRLTAGQPAQRKLLFSAQALVGSRFEKEVDRGQQEFVR